MANTIKTDDLRKLPSPYGYQKPRFVFRDFRISETVHGWKLEVLHGNGLFSAWTSLPFVTEKQCRNLYDKFTLLRPVNATRDDNLLTPANGSQAVSEAVLLRPA